LQEQQRFVGNIMERDLQSHDRVTAFCLRLAAQFVYSYFAAAGEMLHSCSNLMFLKNFAAAGEAVHLRRGGSSPGR
jgi:hypothetical protein